MLFCYDVATYQSKDGKPLPRLMASRGRSFKQMSLALIHEVGASPHFPAASSLRVESLSFTLCLCRWKLFSLVITNVPVLFSVFETRSPYVQAGPGDQWSNCFSLPSTRLPYATMSHYTVLFGLLNCFWKFQISQLSRMLKYLDVSLSP